MAGNTMITFPSSIEDLYKEANELHWEFKALHKAFYGSFGEVIFKGSKAQRKSALKQLHKKKAVKDVAWKAYFQAKESFLKERLSSIEKSLEGEFTPFWWEVLPFDFFDDLREEKEEITCLLKQMKDNGFIS